MAILPIVTTKFGGSRTRRQAMSTRTKPTNQLKPHTIAKQVRFDLMSKSEHAEEADTEVSNASGTERDARNGIGRPLIPVELCIDR